MAGTIMPALQPVLNFLQTRLLSISVANGFYYDVTADQILTIKKDLITDGSAAGPNMALYVIGWDKGEPGDTANYAQVLATVHLGIDFAINVQDSDSPVTDLLKAEADIETAVKADTSQGGTCKNTTSPNLTVWGLDASGWFSASLAFDVLVAWAETTPNQEFATTYNVVGNDGINVIGI